MNQSMIPFEELQSIGRAMAKSGYFSDARDEAQAIVKVLAGSEIGIGPFASMTGIHVIQGKPVLGANLIAALIKNDRRYNYRVTEHTDKVCAITFYEGGEVIGESRVTLDELKRAGSKNLDKYPKNMLFARAISNGAKWHTPGIFGGAPIYTPDEFGMDVDEDGDVVRGDVIDVTPTETPPARKVTREDAAPPPAKWKPDALKWMVKEGYADNDFNANAMWNLLELDDAPGKAAAAQTVKLYRQWRTETDATPEVAAAHAKSGNRPDDVPEVMTPDEIPNGGMPD